LQQTIIYLVARPDVSLVFGVGRIKGIDVGGFIVTEHLEPGILLERRTTGKEAKYNNG